jgi:hypothetical protein
MLGMWWCLHSPWHKWIKCEPVSSIADKLTCSCGREYGMNNSERIMLPWHQVSSLYDDPVFRDDFRAQAKARSA